MRHRNSGKKHKIYIILIIVSFIALFSLSMILVKRGSVKKGNEGNGDNYIYKEGYDLLDISLVDQVSMPVLWDFLNGSMGWKSDVDVTGLGCMFFAVAFNDKNPDSIYVSYYGYGEEIILPPCGTVPLKKVLLDTDVIAVKNAISTMSDERVYEQGEWTVVLVNEHSSYDDRVYDSLDNNYRWAGVSFVGMNEWNPGPMQRYIDEGDGYPTDWLRKETFVNNLYINDIYDEFWDHYRVEQVIKMWKKEESHEQEASLVIKITQYGRLDVEYEGNSFKLNKEDLNYFLEVNGYEQN